MPTLDLLVLTQGLYWHSPPRMVGRVVIRGSEEQGFFCINLGKNKVRAAEGERSR